MPPCFHGVALLVSRVYVYNSGHRWVSHHKRILLAFPSSTHLTFVLTHHSVFTVVSVYSVCGVCSVVGV